MIVPLLIPVCVETNAEKLSFVPSEEKKVAAGVPHRRTVTFLKGNEKSIQDEDRNPMLQKRQLSKNNRYFNEQNLRMRHSIVSDPVDYRIPRSDIETGGLAHKMAKDALKSPKVQETIRKLSRVSPPGHLQATVKIPMTKGNSKLTEDKRNRKGLRHKGRKKKKKKRHHRRYMKQPTQIKRGSPKNYPTNDRIATLNRNSRVLGPDEATFNYATNYGVLDYRNQNYDTSYAAPSVPAEVPEDPQAFEGNNVSDLSNNYDTFDPNKSDGGDRQPVIESQNPDQFEYLNNQYEIPGEQFQSLSTNMPQNLNLNGAVEPLIQPQYLNNYQPIDTNSLGGNFDQTNIMNQPESMRIPNADNYFPIQFYNNQQETQQDNQLENQEKNMENYALQSTFYNRPSVSLPNAMDQPLGKILESLGININGGQNKEINMNENNNRQILPYSNDRTLDVINYIRKRPYEVYKEESTGYGDNNFRGLEYQSFLSKNRNNMKEDQRQLNQNISFGKENVDHDHTNITGAVRDTKQVANEILDTIMEELEDLKDDRLKNNKNREGLPCRLSGSWSTTQAGVKLDMRVVNRTIVVTVSNFTSSRLQESLLNETWNVSGHVPFKRGLPFTLIATHNYTNSIAVFVGACRVCQGIDTIAGVWSVARQPKDCKDLQAATSVFNDIFRKTQLSSLKEGENTENATLKHNKTKS